MQVPTPADVKEQLCPNSASAPEVDATPARNPTWPVLEPAPTAAKEIVVLLFELFVLTKK